MRGEKLDGGGGGVVVFVYFIGLCVEEEKQKHIDALALFFR